MNVFLIYALWALGGLAGVLVFILASGSVRYIGNNRTAVVEKLCSRGGSIRAGLIALNGDESDRRAEPILGQDQSSVHGQK